MKTKLLFSRIQNCKNGIFMVLIIFLITFTSFSQSDGITFDCDGTEVIFGAPDGTDQAGYLYWSNGTFGFSLYVEIDPVEGPVWALHAPGNGILYPDPFHSPGELYWYSPINENPTLCDATWTFSFASCNELIVTCTGGPPDPDNDGDGFPASVDCNDNDPTINTAITYYVDADGDGFGTTAADFCSSTVPSGYAAIDGDCNDNDGAINPNATEVCDGVDNNCDGNADEGLPFTTYYVDADGDGFGDETDAGTDFCSDPGTGYSLTNDDCDDSESQANPDLEEIPFDTIDNDCDGEIDEDDNPPVVYEYCDNKQKKVLICHNGKTKCVSINAVDAHLAHGDYLGPCGNSKEILAEERPTSYDLVSWPNPTNDLFNIRMITPNYEDEVNLQAFDINGRLIYANKIKGNEDYQFGYNLQAGIYFISVTQAENTQVIKVIKQ